MDSSIWVALISLAGSLAGTFAGIIVTNRLTTYRLEQLEKKVDKHNGLVEKTYRLETQAKSLEDIPERVAAVEQSVKSAHKRIDDIA